MMAAASPATGKDFIQTIYFGPPGCGKSFKVRTVARFDLGIDVDGPQLIETAFHPEYTYGDFVAKLLPHSKAHRQAYVVTGADAPFGSLRIDAAHDDVKIEYHIQAGPFLKALARAYASEQPVLLVIDEINRGNCAQIFGDMFQLLDRDAKGWSRYGLDLGQLHQHALVQELARLGVDLSALSEHLLIDSAGGQPRVKLRLPPTLSIIGTMNTSDESVFYMDTAFKRRWDFEYMPWSGSEDPQRSAEQCNAPIAGTDHAWQPFLENLNAFIAENFAGRNVDDKQIGLWFLLAARGNGLSASAQQHAARLRALQEKIAPLKGKNKHADWVPVFKSALKFDKSDHLESGSIKSDFESFGVSWPAGVALGYPELLAARLIDHISDTIKKIEAELTISRTALRNKILFFLWDNVFSRDRSPLEKLLGPSPSTRLRTFGDFATEENLGSILDVLMRRSALDDGARP
jgi:hypothetical protein